MRTGALALIAAAAGGAGATAAIAVAQASPAHPAIAAVGNARVQGSFRAAGRVTAVEHVSGVRQGERFSRTWTLVGEDCRASSCSKLKLEARLELGAGAVDTVTLSRTGDGAYRWRRTVSSHALCRARHITGAYRSASALNLTVSQRAEVNGVWYATALTAAWSTASGGCGVTASRSAVSYAATVRSGVPAGALPTGSTTSSSAAPTSTAETTTFPNSTGTATVTTVASTPSTTFPSSTGTTPIATTVASTPSPTVPTTTVPHGPQPEAGT